MNYTNGNYEAFARPRKPLGVENIPKKRKVGLGFVLIQVV